MRLWTAQSVSAFGSQITAVALPLTAVVTLGASAEQMAALAAAWSASGLAAGLLAGWLADRFSRRAILVTTDAAFAVVAGSIPLAAALGRLNMTQLSWFRSSRVRRRRWQRSRARPFSRTSWVARASSGQTPNSR